MKIPNGILGHMKFPCRPYVASMFENSGL